MTAEFFSPELEPEKINIPHAEIEWGGFENSPEKKLLVEKQIQDLLQNHPTLLLPVEDSLQKITFSDASKEMGESFGEQSSGKRAAEFNPYSREVILYADFFGLKKKNGRERPVLDQSHILAHEIGHSLISAGYIDLDEAEKSIVDDNSLDPAYFSQISNKRLLFMERMAERFAWFLESNGKAEDMAKKRLRWLSSPEKIKEKKWQEKFAKDTRSFHQIFTEIKASNASFVKEIEEPIIDEVIVGVQPLSVTQKGIDFWQGIGKLLKEIFSSPNTF